MANSLRRVIVRTLGFDHQKQLGEGTAQVQLLPGQVVELVFPNTALAEILKLNAVAGQKVRRVVLENFLKGDDKATAIPINQVAQYFMPRSGDRVQLRIATSQVLSAGDYVKTDAAGNLVKWIAPVALIEGTSTTVQEEVTGDAEYVKAGQVVEAITTTSATAMAVVEIL